jgi:hypothetical protein
MRPRRKNHMGRVVLAFIVVLPIAFLASDTPSQPLPTTAAQERYPAERLNQIRESLAAQIAVFDAAEDAMRAPTPAEAAELALTGESPRETISLPGGGVALRSSPSDLSFVVATVSEDGAVRVAHDRASAGAPNRPAKGGSHVR